MGVEKKNVDQIITCPITNRIPRNPHVSSSRIYLLLVVRMFLPLSYPVLVLGRLIGANLSHSQSVISFRMFL